MRTDIIEVVICAHIVNPEMLTIAKHLNLEIINIGTNGQYTHVQFRGRPFEIDSFADAISKDDRTVLLMELDTFHIYRGETDGTVPEGFFNNVRFPLL